MWWEVGWAVLGLADWQEVGSEKEWVEDYLMIIIYDKCKVNINLYR